MQDFLTLSRRVFQPRSIWRRALNLLLSGSQYSSQPIDQALESQFGDCTLSDYSPAIARTAKFVITVKGTPRGDYVMSNFNGVGRNEARRNYEHVLTSMNGKGIRVWEA